MPPKMSEGVTSSPSPVKDSHYHLCKKVAQLTKVIVQLNTLNERNAAEKQKHEAEKQRLVDAHSNEIANIKNEIVEVKSEAESKVNDLQDQINSKDAALLELGNQLKSVQDESQSSLADKQRVLEQLQREKDEQQASHNKTVRELSQSLEQQSRQHELNIVCLRNELAEEHKSNVDIIKQEIIHSHNEEIDLLRTRHVREIQRCNTEAEKQQSLAVCNAVSLARLEHEKVLSTQLAKHNEQIEAVKTEITGRLGLAINSLQEELDRSKQQVEETKATLDVHVLNEEKLHKDVVRLQEALEAMAVSNQTTITELQTQNTELSKDLRTANDTLDNRHEQIKGIELENQELKDLVDNLDDQKSSVEADLAALSQTLEQERQLSTSQLKDRDALLLRKSKDLDNVENANANLMQQLNVATNEVSVLSEYKSCSQQTIASLETDLKQSRSSRKELAQLDVSSITEFAVEKQAMISTHSNERTKLENNSRDLQDRIDNLQSVVDNYEASAVESKTTTQILEKKVQFLEENAHNVQEAREGERLPYESAMDNVKAQARKDIARVTCMSMDEQDILNNQIASLRDAIKDQEVKALSKERLLVLDYQGKMEEQDAVMSKLRYQSALDIQGLTLKLGEQNERFQAKESECNSLMNSIDTLREQQVSVAQDHDRELSNLSSLHETELMNINASHEEMICQKNKDIDHIKQASDDAAALHQQTIDNLNSRLVSDRSNQISELKELKSQLVDLQEDVESIQNEWKSTCSGMTSKLKAMETEHDLSVQRHKGEMQELQTSLFQAEEAFTKQIAAKTQEVAETKAIHFNTVRENKMKLETANRNLKLEHEEEIKTLQNDSRIQCEVVYSKLKDMSSEYEALAKANAKKVDVIILKDRDINSLKTKMSDTTKSCEEEIKSLKLQQDQNLKDEIKRTEAAMEEKSKREKQELKTEMQTKVEQVSSQLQIANERWESRSSLPADVEHISWLQSENERLNLSETKSREMMLHYKRELENRETSYNKRFVPKGDKSSKSSPLRVKDDNGDTKQRKKTVGTKTTSRSSGTTKAGTSTTRKKKASSRYSVSGRLPKL